MRKRVRLPRRRQQRPHEAIESGQYSSSTRSGSVRRRGALSARAENKRFLLMQVSEEATPLRYRFTGRCSGAASRGAGCSRAWPPPSSSRRRLGARRRARHRVGRDAHGPVAAAPGARDGHVEFFRTSPLVWMFFWYFGFRRSSRRRSASGCSARPSSGRDIRVAVPRRPHVGGHSRGHPGDPEDPVRGRRGDGAHDVQAYRLVIVPIALRLSIPPRRTNRSTCSKLVGRADDQRGRAHFQTARSSLQRGRSKPSPRAPSSISYSASGSAIMARVEASIRDPRSHRARG